MKNYGKRLLQAMEYSNNDQYSVANAVGIKQPSVNHLINKADGSKKTASIALLCRVDPYWLETGEGEMIAGNTNSSAVNLKPKLPKDKEVLLNAYDKLSDDEKERLLMYLKIYNSESNSFLPIPFLNPDLNKEDR